MEQLIRTMRERAGYSQAELARRAGISRTVVNAYENGHREPGASALLRLAEACGQRLAVVPRAPLDAARSNRVLQEVLDLAEQLPRRKRADRIDFPGLSRGGRT